MTRLVRSASLTHFAEVAAQFGLDAPALVAQVGLPTACLANPDLKIDAQVTLALIEHAAAQAGDLAFGVRMGERRRMSNIGPLAVALRDEPTLQHVLDVLVNHIRLHNEALVIQTERQGDVVVIRLDLLTEQGRYFRQGTELAVLVTLQNSWVRSGIRAWCVLPMHHRLHWRCIGDFLAYRWSLGMTSMASSATARTCTRPTRALTRSWRGMPSSFCSPCMGNLAAFRTRSES